MRISDWSSDVCSSDLYGSDAIAGTINVITKHDYQGITLDAQYGISEAGDGRDFRIRGLAGYNFAGGRGNITVAGEYNQEAGLTNFARPGKRLNSFRSEEHTSELQSLMRNSYAVFCLNKKN